MFSTNRTAYFTNSISLLFGKDSLLNSQAAYGSSPRISQSKRPSFIAVCFIVFGNLNRS